MLEQRIIELEQRLQRVIMRGIVAQINSNGSYTVIVQTDYDDTMYITQVLYMPFVTEIIFQIPKHFPEDIPADSALSGPLPPADYLPVYHDPNEPETYPDTYATRATDPYPPTFQSSPAGNPSHSHVVPVRTAAQEHYHNVPMPNTIREHAEVTVVFPIPVVDDRVWVWSPNGNPQDFAIIVGRFTDREDVNGVKPRIDKIILETEILEDIFLMAYPRVRVFFWFIQKTESSIFVNPRAGEENLRYRAPENSGRVF